MVHCTRTAPAWVMSSARHTYGHYMCAVHACIAPLVLSRSCHTLNILRIACLQPVVCTCLRRCTYVCIPHAIMQARCCFSPTCRYRRLHNQASLVWARRDFHLPRRVPPGNTCSIHSSAVPRTCNAFHFLTTSLTMSSIGSVHAPRSESAETWTSANNSRLRQASGTNASCNALTCQPSAGSRWRCLFLGQLG
jgi:hypothetical protein